MKYDTFNFDLLKVSKHANSIKDIEKAIDYIKYVINEINDEIKKRNIDEKEKIDNKMLLDIMLSNDKLKVVDPNHSLILLKDNLNGKLKYKEKIFEINKNFNTELFDTFDFYYNRIIDFCDNIKNYKNKITFLEFVIREANRVLIDFQHYKVENYGMLTCSYGQELVKFYNSAWYQIKESYKKEDITKDIVEEEFEWRVDQKISDFKLLLKRIDKEMEFIQQKKTMNELSIDGKGIGRNEYNIFDYSIEKILNHCNLLETINEKLIYLYHVRKEFTIKTSQNINELNKLQSVLSKKNIYFVNDEQHKELRELHEECNKKYTRIIQEIEFLEKNKRLLSNTDNYKTAETKLNIEELEKIFDEQFRKRTKSNTILETMYNEINEWIEIAEIIETGSNGDTAYLKELFLKDYSENIIKLKLRTENHKQINILEKYIKQKLEELRPKWLKGKNTSQYLEESLNDEINEMERIDDKLFDTFNFDYKKIRKALEDEKDIKAKKMHLAYIKKELKRVIRCFESDRFTSWKEKAEDCFERDIFIRERYEFHNEVYGGGKHNIDKYVEEDIKDKLAELKDCLSNIEDEIEFIDSTGIKKDGWDVNDYQTMWIELISNYFSGDFLRKQLENIGFNNEDSYLEFIKKKFRHRTIEEWMAFYRTEDKRDQVENIKKVNLPPKNEYDAIINVTKANFDESTLGIEILGNLESFQEKYLSNNKIVIKDIQKLETFKKAETINNKEIIENIQENDGKKEVPSKGLKKLAKETCETLIKNKTITDVLTESKTDKTLSKMIIDGLQKDGYNISKRNENTISDYFRKYDLQIKKEKNGNLVVIDNYLRK